MAEEESKEQKKKLPVIAVIVLLILVAGGVTVYLSLFVLPIDKVGEELSPPKMVTVPLGEDMLINLHGTRVFLRLNVVMEYNAEDQRNRNLGDDLRERNHILQHEVIKLLRAKSIDDVRPPGSEDKIAEEITKLINKKLEELKIEGRIERVYFTEYIVQ
ncbi:flagellar basal body-associated FliL family protein [Peptococcaceae bacterium]|nr:flagellar basal body-associated FliL family protein [Peptococcaceae bacterium]